jgi:DNA-binding PadR family transcriptional regulator
MKGERLGEFEELTLLAIRAIEPPVYGVPIQRFLERMTGRDVTMGAVYSALDRLEAKGFVTSTFGASTAARGGKAKRLFSVTPTGVRALGDLKATRERIWRVIQAR